MTVYLPALKYFSAIFEMQGILMSTTETAVNQPKNSAPTNVLYTRILGVIGMAFPIYGNLIPPSNERALCFIIGAILLFIAAAWERELLFSVLQLIVLAGAAMYFTPFDLVVRAAVPIVLAIAFLIYFAYSGRLQDRLLLFGCISIVFLALGYAIANPFIYFIGGVVLTIYATLSFLRGSQVAILWAFLNLFFSIASAINIYYTLTS